MTSTSLRVRAALLAVAVVAVVPATAQAAPKAGERYGASAGRHSSCTTGATCTTSSSAGQAGSLSASSGYVRRDVGVDRPHEASLGWGTHSASLSVPPGSASVTVSGTWQLEDVTAKAAATAGTAYALVYLRLSVPGCSSDASSPCVVGTTTPEHVRRVYDFPEDRLAGLPQFSQGVDGNQTVTASLTVTAKDGRVLPKTLWATAEVGTTTGGYPDCEVPPGCPESLKRQHAGSSSAGFSGTLVGLRVSAL